MKKKAGFQIGIGITGYAAPVPEEDIIKVFAWFAVARNKSIVDILKITGKEKDPVKVQIDYTNQIIKKTIRLLE